MPLGQDFTKAGYKLVSHNPANKSGNLSILTPKGSQNASPEFYNRLMSEGVQITPGYIPEDMATKNPALKTQDYLAQQGLGGLYTSRLGQFDENQFNQEIQNVQTEQKLDANLAQTTGIQNPTTTDANGNKVMTGIPNPGTVQAQPFTNGVGPQGGVQNVGGGMVGGETKTLSPQEQAFNATKTAGVQNPQSASEFFNVQKQYGGSPQQQNGPIDLLMSQNQNYQKYLDDFALSQTSQMQGQSLVQQYNQYMQQLGIPGIDAQLLNLKSIMDGREDEIRQQITIAGGFATNEQVEAMTNARNKVTLQNYNNLQNTRNNALNNLTTVMGLAEKDRAYAEKQIDRQLDFDRQKIEYTDKLIRYGEEKMQKNLDRMGFDGLYSSVNGDPHAVGLIEQSLGLPQGGLLQGALQAEKAKVQAEQTRQLDMQEKQLGMKLKGEQILTEQAQRQKIYNEISTSGSNFDPAQVIAYAQQYASTGTIPTGLPKGTFGVVAQYAKELPKSQGQILDRATGVSPDKMGVAGDAYGALYSAIELSKQLKDLDQNRWGGITAGLVGKVAGSENQSRYLDLRQQIVDLLARARTGAAINASEEALYSSMLPGRWNNPFFLGTDSAVRINNFGTALTSDLINKTNSKGWVVNGLTPVKIDNQNYKVGDVIQNESGQSGRINSDGSISVIK